MSDFTVHSDNTHLTDEGTRALSVKVAAGTQTAFAISAHAALKAWSETEEGQTAIAAVGGLHESNPLYLAFMAGYYTRG